MVHLERFLKKCIATDDNPVNYTKIGSTEHNLEINIQYHLIKYQTFMMLIKVTFLSIIILHI